jgi:predicted esterase
LAPFVAQALPHVDHVIGIGSQFLVDEMKFPVRFQADVIHGKLDEVVSFENTKKAHDTLLKLGVHGRFRLLEETGHRMDTPVQNSLRELLYSC